MRGTLRHGPTSETREIVSWLQEVVNKLSTQRDLLGAVGTMVEIKILMCLYILKNRIYLKIILN